MNSEIDDIDALLAKGMTDYTKFTSDESPRANSLQTWNERKIYIEVTSFHGYIEMVEDLRRTYSRYDADSTLIFRGMSDISYRLIPSIMRTDYLGDKKPTKELIDCLENKLIDEFKKRARPHVGALPLRKRRYWEWRARAQHHFLPTRLLDWTERAGTAMYFAVFESLAEFSCVWCITAPEELSVKATKNADELGGVKLYRPPHISPRITMQQGCFTVHPGDYQSEVYRWINGPPVIFVVRKSNRGDVIAGLNAVGINRAALFPDLDSIAKHLKETIRP